MTGYYIGTLGNALPVPGGIGGVEGGMIGAFLGFSVKGSLATLAVLGYRTISTGCRPAQGRSPTSTCEVGTTRRARANTSRLNERVGESQELVEEARRRIPALGGVHADASFGDAIDELRRYGQSVDVLVIGSHHYGPIDRVLEESASQQLADEPSSRLLVLAA